MECNKCEKSFSTKRSLAHHKKSETSCINNLLRKKECDKCGKIFTRAFNLTRHENRKTPCIKVYKHYFCVNCNKEYSCYNSLWSHNKVCRTDI